MIEESMLAPGENNHYWLKSPGANIDQSFSFNKISVYYGDASELTKIISFERTRNYEK